MAVAERIGAPSGEEISDQDVVDRVRNGDGASFELIMRRHNRRLYRIARGILRNEAEAEDAVQEAYVRAYEKLDRFKGDGYFSAWLAKITVNEALGRLRGAASAKNSLSLDDPEQANEVNSMAELTFSGPNPEQSVARGEFRRLLESAIDDLPESYRLVFILRGLEEMTVAETADCLEVEPATVKTRYHRARKILQQSLAGLVEATAGEAFPFAGERCDRIVAGVLRRLGIRGQQ
ncbi:RNA polymerase sigma factor [Desulfuromonas sp. TF]|uniref:RNA polymerase sigma factor n=1 Tax=Desulfuromonas sp. TF TaxID=1232410 RepID=UPI0004214865|nr:RNA polymerase sigma factor [Desulfuromonas sp. TF]